MNLANPHMFIASYRDKKSSILSQYENVRVINYDFYIGFVNNSTLFYFFYEIFSKVISEALCTTDNACVEWTDSCDKEEKPKCPLNYKEMLNRIFRLIISLIADEFSIIFELIELIISSSYSTFKYRIQNI